MEPDKPIPKTQETDALVRLKQKKLNNKLVAAAGKGDLEKLREFLKKGKQPDYYVHVSANPDQTCPDFPEPGRRAGGRNCNSTRAKNLDCPDVCHVHGASVLCPPRPLAPPHPARPHHVSHALPFYSGRPGILWPSSCSTELTLG